ncbi:hypothetical protein D3C80_577260 [compost metagenome]
MASSTELLETILAKLGHRSHCRLEIFARIELAWILLQHAADLTCQRHTVVRVDIDLAHTMLDAALDFFNRHTPGWLHLAAILVDDFLQIFRHRRRTMHDKMRVWQLAMDFFDHIHRQH